MAKYEVEFDRDGKITIRNEEFIRRLKMCLLQDQRLVLNFAPERAEDVMMLNPKCPPDRICPDPILGGKCPGPEDAYCPLFLRNVIVQVRNEWAWDESWKDLGGR